MRSSTAIPAAAIVAAIPAFAGLAPAEPRPPEPLGPGGAVGAILFEGYGSLLRPGRGGRCPMSPTCSAYSRAAVRELGLGRGVLATSDRLLRCGSDAMRYPAVFTARGRARLDPVPAGAAAPAPGAADTPVDAPPEASRGRGAATSAAETLDFAEWLLRAGDPEGAAVEFRRAAYLAESSSDDSPVRDRAVAGLGRAWTEGGAPGRAIAWLEPRRAALRDGSARRDARRTLTRGYLVLRLPGRLEELGRTLEGPEQRLYPALADLLRHDFPGAEAGFREAAGTPDEDVARAGRRDAGVAASLGRERFPSPRTAATLGLVPGAGYLYAGYPGAALSALILNAAFAAATWQAFDSDQNVLGGTLAFFTLTWYGGGIYGAHHSARRRNEATLDYHLPNLEY